MEPLDISIEMEALFGLVEIGRELAIQGFMYMGMTRVEAEDALYEQEMNEFVRKEEPPFSAAFPEATIWG